LLLKIFKEIVNLVHALLVGHYKVTHSQHGLHYTTIPIILCSDDTLS